MKRHTTNLEIKVSMTIRISYDSGISRVWVNGETHDRFGDKVTPEFKKRLNKWQLVKIKIKKKERKLMITWH